MKLKSTIQESSKKSQKTNSHLRSQIKPLKLSQCLQTQLNQKLSLVHKGITIIDVIPIKYYQTIKTLYLSGNFIRSLENIQYFLSLESLSLANNCVKQMSTIRYLLPLKNLTNLVFQNNPITKRVFYYGYVVGMIDTLHMLDHHSVQPQTKQNQINNFLVYEEGMQAMLENYVTLLQIFRLYKKIQLHQAIKSIAKQISSEQEVSYFSINLYVNLSKSYYHQLPSNVLISFENHLYNDLQQIVQQAITQANIHTQSKKYQLFFAAIYILQQRQISKIQQLKEKFTTKVQEISLQTIQKNQEYQNVKEIMENVYRQESNYCLGRQFWSKKLKSKYFKKIKNRFQKISHKIISTSFIFDKITHQVNKILYIPFWKQIKQKACYFILEKATQSISRELIKPLIKLAFDSLNNYSKIINNLNNFREKIQNKKFLKKVFLNWKKQTLIQKLLKYNNKISKQIEQQYIKEEKYLTKISLLEKLVIISEEQNSQALNNSSYKKINSFLSKRSITQKQENQNYGLIQRNLYQQITNEKQSININKQNCINLNNSQEKFNHSHFTQRKFNSKNLEF